MPHSFAEQLRSLPMSPNLGQSLERAHRSARDQSHRLVTLEHLLLALTEDAEAALILQSANVDLGKLSTDVSGYLGRFLDDMRAEPGAEPRPDSELLRVLQAAASAAQQSRRKQIDGAIVLAAIVGDGKSPAAGLLKALGMTFEEAIRALQRANTKARLKPLAKPPTPPQVATDVQAETPAVSGAELGPENAEGPDAPEPGATRAEGPTPNLPLAAQSADEILAAARARIQKRAAAAVAKTEPATPRRSSEPPPRDADARSPAELDVGPEIEPVDSVQTKSLTAAIEAAMASSTSRGGAPMPVTRPSPPASPRQEAMPAAGVLEKTAPGAAAAGSRPARPAWNPRADSSKPSMHAPQPPPARAPQGPPLPARAVQPSEGPRRPPLPQRTGQQVQPQPAFPGPRTPWPPPAEQAARPSLTNGSSPEAHATFPHGFERPDLGAKPLPAPPPAWPAQGGRAAAQTERALLVESVPRRMRVGVPTTAEVRVARAKIDTLIAALNARGGAQHSSPTLARALAVRLGAPDGNFWVEPAGPEMHWPDASPATAQDEFITWRWTVVPRRRGRKRLTLMVSSQTVGRDGLVAQSALPERAVDVKVGPNQARRVLRVAGLLVAVAAGVLAGRHWQELLVRALAAIDKMVALLGA